MLKAIYKTSGLLVLILNLFKNVETFEVTTPLGKVLGHTLTSRLGKTIYSFRSIRYAQPPINELRFKPPVPVTKWDGVYNATITGPVCPQPTTTDVVSEDCLFLNVYTTKLPESGHNPKRPVIIILHSGGFYSSTCNSDWCGPQYFLDQDIVLVALNYRLATLGFLSIGKDSPGNNGLKDQVLALKWVRDNIACFGGDPDNVTLFGDSAGSWSIILHMISPMSRGLFHKGILSSGSPLGIYPLPTQQLNLAKRQAGFVGCPTDTPRKIFDCLKTVPAETLGNSLPQFAEFGKYDSVLQWSPVIEEDHGQERFLTENPIKKYLRGDFMKIPVILGITKDEFDVRAIPVVANKTLLQQLSDNFEKYAPISFVYERDTEKSKEVSRAVRRFYLGEGPLNNNSVTGLGDLYADAIVGFGVNRATKLIAAKNTQPTYYYEFTYEGRYSYFYWPLGNKTVPYGVVHQDDLMYTYYISKLFPFFDDTFPEAKMVDIMTSLWANFAKHGEPVPITDRKFEGVRWEPYNLHTQRYMDIGKKLVLRERLFEERYAFWEKLYPLSSYQ